MTKRPHPGSHVVKAALKHEALTVEMIMGFIDDATLPTFMDKSTALGILQEVKDEIDGRIEALRCEIQDKP